MTAKITKLSENKVEIKLTIEFNGNMLESEEIIQDELNKAGKIATEELLKKFDTDGSNISVGGKKFYSKGAVKKNT